MLTIAFACNDCCFQWSGTVPSPKFQDVFLIKISALEPAYALKKNFVGVIFGAQKVDLIFFWKFENFQ